MMLLDLVRAKPGRTAAVAVALLFAAVLVSGLVVLAATSQSTTTRAALIAVTGGLLFGCAALSHVALRTVGELRRLQAGRRLAAAQLARNEERFRLLAENARDMIYRYRLTPEPGFEYVSPASMVITGYTPEEHYADPRLGFEMVHPDDRHLLEGTLHSPKSRLTLRWRRKDGRIIWTEQRNKVIYDPSGEPVAIEGIARDVTESKRAEEELERLSHRNELILKSAGEGIYGLGQDARTTFVNPAAARMLGYEPDELIGRHQHEVIHHSFPDGTLYPPEECPIHAALKDGRVHASSGEVFWRRDGTSFPVEYVSTPIREKDEIVGAVVTFNDITERRRAEEELARSEERFRLLAENMSDLVCLHASDGRYLYVSPSCRKLLGYEPEELIGADPYDLFHPEDAERIRSGPHRLALDGETPAYITYRLRKKDGEYTWLETLTEPILDEEGRVVRLQTSSRDVNDRRKAEEALARLVRARTEFLADVSHELRTPLTVILGNAEVGLDLDCGCDHADLLQEIVREASTMSRMVEDLLFLARSDSPAPPFHPERVSTSSFLSSLSARASSLAQERGATLEAHLEGSGHLRIDPTRVEQAVLALVDNAAKYTPEGEEISLSSREGNGALIITVEDRGPGIPEKDLPRVFERFYRVDDDRPQDGNGLGLSIAAAIAEAHGGSIRAHSRVGEGTRMLLHLPLLQTSHAEGASNPAAPNGQNSQR
jgi:PAS domain S-box-containing protein